MTDVDDMSGLDELKNVKVSKLTLGLIMSVAATSGMVVWQAAQLANRIGGLESTVVQLQEATGAEFVAQIGDLTSAVQANAQAIDDLTDARVADIERFAPEHLVDVLIDEIEGLKVRVADIEDLDIEGDRDAVWYTLLDLEDRIDELHP